jgi:hypothetical protein
LPVGQEVHPHHERVVDGVPAVRVGGWLAAVVAQDIREHGQRRGGRFFRAVAVLLEQAGPLFEVVRHVVGRVPGVEVVLGVLWVDKGVDRRVTAPVDLD